MESQFMNIRQIRYNCNKPKNLARAGLGLFFALQAPAGCSSGKWGNVDESVNHVASALSDCTNVPQWAVGTYSGGDRVQNNGVLYECKPFPFSGWCGQIGYQPGVDPAWSDAWTRIDDCATSSGTGGTGGTGGGGSGGTGGACDPAVENCCPP